MKVRLKGINKVRKRLADGSAVTHYYAWRGKGAPRLKGDPGSPEFIASYDEAHKSRAPHHQGTLQALITAYQKTPYFKDKADSTRRDYLRHIREIEREFGDMPIAALSDRRTRGEFMSWRDRRAASSPGRLTMLCPFWR